MLQELSALVNNSGVPLSTLLVNLIAGMGFSILLRWHFRHFSSVLSNRDEFAQVFPFILLTTIFIISIVKSSLALSLGLVGALSIVRFRTPVKEPEELAYLFMCIAVGLGLGANQTGATIIAGTAILGCLAMLNWVKSENSNKKLYLSIDWIAEDPHENHLDELNALITKHTMSNDLRRLDLRQGAAEATYILDLASPNELSSLTREIRKEFPNVGITFLDQNQMPHV